MLEQRAAVKASIKDIKAIAETNNNQISANLLKSLGYTVSKQTKKMLEGMGISITRDIEIDEFLKKGGKLTPQEAVYFAIQAQMEGSNADKAKEVLWRAFMPYITRLAVDICRNHLTDVEDVESAGKVGLMKAIKCFDHGCSLYFVTYANSIIRGYMLKGNNKIVTPFHVSEDVEIAVMHLMKYANSRDITNWSDNDINEAARAYNLTVKKVKTYIQYFHLFNLKYIDTLSDTDVDSVTDTDRGIGAKRNGGQSYGKSPSAEDQYFTNDNEAYVLDVLSGLSSEDKEMFMDFAGLKEDGKRMSIKAIGEKYDMSRYNVEKRITAIREDLIKKIA